MFDDVQPLEAIRMIGRLSREMDGDLRALGPHHARVAGVEVRKNLVDALRLMAEAFEAMRAASGPYVKSQLRQLGLDSNRHGLKVQIGGGTHRIEGWVNIDLHPAELALNVRWGLPFADGAVRCIYASHVLEHFFFRFEALPLLQEMHRVLEPGGVARIVVPDIGGCMEAWARHDDAFFEARKKVWPWAEVCKTHLEHFLEYAGANAFDMGFEGHKYGYDFDTLAALLKEAGFVNVERSAYMSSVQPDLNLDHVSPFASATSGGDHYSLFVDALKAAQPTEGEGRSPGR